MTKPSNYTLKQAFNKAVSTQWKSQQAAHTTIQRATGLIEFLGPGMPIVEANAKEVMKFREYCSEVLGNSNATINAKISTLKTMRQMAVLFGDVEHLPEMPRNLTLDNHKNIVWEDPEIDAVCEDLIRRGRSDIARFFVFLIEMGCRPIEMRRQTREDYDFKNKTVTFFKRAHDNKTANRVLPLTPLAFDIAKLQVPKLNSIKVWKIDKNELYFQVKKSLERCGIHKTFIIKATRHTCATRLGRRGCSSLEIAAWLGHSSEQMCQRYVHMPHDQHAKAFDALTKLREAA
tara:strand:- start:7939 stop:8805 length:867 start_codon:yes stop_codon:yes gene_type:complete